MYGLFDVFPLILPFQGMSCVVEGGCHVVRREEVMCCGGRMSCVEEGGCHVLWREDSHVLSLEDVMCCGGRMVMY